MGVSMNDDRDAFTLDRSFFRIRSRDDERDEVDYWLTQPPQRRIQAVEFLRESFHGRAYSQRLERLFKIVERA